MTDGPAGSRAEMLAATVNAIVVLLAPSIALLVAMMVSIDGNTSVTVRPAGASRVQPVVRSVIEMGAWMLPFATIAAWRTWVHAQRWSARQGSGWQGVAEAGACGLAAALLYLVPGIVTRPRDAAPYVMAYGGAATIVGLLFGLVLRTTALLILRFSPCEDVDACP